MWYRLIETENSKILLRADVTVVLTIVHIMVEYNFLNNYLLSFCSVWVTEDIPYDHGLKQCKPQVQDSPWLSPAAPVPADGILR